MNSFEYSANLVSCTSESSSDKSLPQEYSFLIKAVLYSLIVRLLYLAFIILMQSDEFLFILEDDILYDIFGNEYLNGADRIIDNHAFELGKLSIGGINHYQSWFWIVAVITYFFKKTIYVRLLNILLSSFIPILIYHFCQLNEIEKEKSRLACKLYVFMPYAVIMSCYPFKDVFLSFLVLYLINLFTGIVKNKFKLKARHVLQLVVLYFLIKDLRQGAFESIAIVFFAIYFFMQTKSLPIKTFLIALEIAVVFFMFELNFLEAIINKFDTYAYYNRSNSSISFFRVDSYYQLYKLPGMFCFSILQPMLSPSVLVRNDGLIILSILNLTAVPVMFWNILSIFRNRSFLCYLSVFLMTISSFLTLGTFRHFFYVIPFIYINCAIMYKSSTASERFIVNVLSFLTALLVICIVVFK